MFNILSKATFLSSSFGGAHHLVDGPPETLRPRQPTSCLPPSSSTLSSSFFIVTYTAFTINVLDIQYTINTCKTIGNP